MKTINDLRATLFDTLESIKSGTIDLEKAKAINDLGQTIINSAKVEVDHMKVSGSLGSGFIDSAGGNGAPMLPGESINERTSHGFRTVSAIGHGVTITRHRAT
jgi:hypothetical protein